MKRINILWIIWIFVTLEFKDVACVSYPGVYRNELPLIVPGASPIETAFVTERYGINYECIETCYPILHLCDDKCSDMPDLPECSHCQRLPDVHPTPIIIETPPYEPIPPYQPFEPPITPIVSYPLPLPRPPLLPKPNPPLFPSPPRPILPEVPRPPVYDLVPPTPILPDIPQPPEVQTLQPPLPSVPEPPGVETEIPIEITVPDVPSPDVFLDVPTEVPPKPILPHVPRPPQYENIAPPLPKLPEPPLPKIPEPPLPKIPEPPQPQPPIFEVPLPTIPTLPEVPTPQLEVELPPEPILPDMETFSQLPPELPYIPVPSEQPTIVPSITIYEPPQTPVLQPVIPDIVRIPNPVLPEQAIIITTYPDNPETPTVTEYRDICSDYCLQKRNTSECEICLKTGVPAEHSELCSNCLVNPSEADCELCYPILFNLCREFCIFEENEPDCSMCYPQPITLMEEVVDVAVPVLPMPIEYCPDYCAHTPALPECEGCGIGVEVIEKVCIDICAGYCLDNPNDEQCAVCYSEDTVENPELVPVEWPTLEVINYQCCYGDYCTPMPRSGICPVVCKDQCTTACSNDCFNPTCPDCQEIVAVNEYQRAQFMIWLKSKLSDMKSRYMAMIEACIRRTELMYERELQAIEMEVDTTLAMA